MKIPFRYRKIAAAAELKRIYFEKRDRELIAKNKDKRVLVILHLFYPESTSEIISYLKNLRPYNWDLVVTYPIEKEKTVPFGKIRKVKDAARFVAVENKGYDVAPFLNVLKTADIDNYDVVIKLHSKGVKRPKIYIYEQLFLFRDWFVCLFEGTVGAKYLHRTIDTLCSGNDVGMISASNLIVNDPSYKAGLVLSGLHDLGLPLENSFDRKYRFIAGTCFAVRPSVLAPLKDTDINSIDFSDVPKSRGMSAAHLLERYMCMLVSDKGFRIEGNEVCVIRRAIKKPVEKIFYSHSVDRMTEEKYIFNDGYLYWILDNKLVRYKKRRTKLSELKYHYDLTGKDMRIADSPAYRYLCGDKAAYAEYCDFHKKNGLPCMSTERFDNLFDSISENGFDERNIILVNDRNKIRDGHHRACVLARLRGLDSEADVLQVDILDKRYLIKKLVPAPILKKIYKYRFGA